MRCIHVLQLGYPLAQLQARQFRCIDTQLITHLAAYVGKLAIHVGQLDAIQTNQQSFNLHALRIGHLRLHIQQQGVSRVQLHNTCHHPHTVGALLQLHIKP